MTNSVVNSNNDYLPSTADFGGQRLLGIPSLTDYINNGSITPVNILPKDTFNSQMIKQATSPGDKAAKTISIISGLIAAGVGIAYLVKTGKVDFLVNKFKAFGKDVAEAAIEIWQDISNKIFKKR